jgi:hypothetical protein
MDDILRTVAPDILALPGPEAVGKFGREPHASFDLHLHGFTSFVM